MRIKILPYKMGSKSAKGLSEGLKVQRVKPDGMYMPRKDDLIINWGNVNNPKWLDNFEYMKGTYRFLNPPWNVHHASNKLECLYILNDNKVPIPTFTTDLRMAANWLADDAIVVERHKLRAHSGDGIRLCESEFDLQRAPLYTLYQKKTHEYRVHVLPDGTTVLNQKRRRKEIPDKDVCWKVRNYDNGFVYCRENVEENQRVKDVALQAVQALGLDFGAVDVIFHKPSDTVMVLEVNTAPGLEGSLLESYVKAFQEVAQ